MNSEIKKSDIGKINK